MTKPETKKFSFIAVALLLIWAPTNHGFSPRTSLVSTHANQVSVSRTSSLLRLKEGATAESDDDELSNPKEKRTPPLPLEPKKKFKAPPLLVEDFDLLSGDVFLLLLVSLVSSGSVHEHSLAYLALALNEASLLCILWIAAGLSSGAFLYSAVDGHYRPGDEKGGPMAAGMLGLNTTIFASNLRVILAILTYKVGWGEPEKELILLEIGLVIALMSGWRMWHSSNTPRM